MTDKQLDNTLNYINRLTKELATIAGPKCLAEKVDIHRIIKQAQQLKTALQLHTYIITD